MPASNWHNMINVRHSNTGNDHGFQLSMGYYSNDLYSRSYQGGTGSNNGNYQSWAKQWSSANDGAGSGLDADLLDGQQGSYYAPATSLGNYLPLAGGAMTGNIQMNNQIFATAGNYGRGVFGLYSASKYQHVWSMGTAYKLADNGDSSGTGGNLYGLAWSYNPDHGYSGSNAQSKPGLNHQLLLMMNGTTKFAAGNGMWTSGNATIEGGASIGGDLVASSNSFMSGYLKVTGDIRGNGQQLVLNAGESYAYATGQTSEHVYVNAEAGLIISSSPDNWSSGWAGRNNTYINRADGTSSFTGKISVQGSNVIEIDQGTSSFNHIKVLSTLGSKLFSSTNYGYVLESSATAANPVTFRFDNDRYRIYSGANGEALTVLKNKNVGIGVTSPGSKLEVGGNAIIDGVLTIEGPAPVATSPMLKLTRTSPVVDYQDLGTYYLLTERFKNSGGTVIGSREVWQNPGGSGLYYNFDNGSTGGSQHRQKQNSFHWTINSTSEKLTLGTNGYLGVNDTSPSYQLDVNGSGRFTSTVTATNFILSSDERLKENIEKVCDNRVEVDWKTFELKADKGQKRYGVIAQELEKTNPEFVREGADGFKSVAYIDLLIAKIAELEARLEKLEK